MKQADYIRLTAQIAVLKEIAVDYSGKTIDNSSKQLRRRWRMIRVNAYRCSHCGKLFLTERRCIKHEEKYCNKSPCNIAACYSCKWYKETEQTTTITRTGVNPLTWYEYEYEKEVSINLCLKHHNAKMFNSFHASEELIDDAENGGLCIMPTMEEGCLDYKKKKNED